VKKREKEDAASQKTAPRSSKPLSRPNEKKTPKFMTYTPLAVPRAKILQEAFSADSLPAPRKKPPPPDADGSKHCQYHRTIGHTTEECHMLRDKIEELIRQGHLKKYIQQDRPQQSPMRNRSPARRPAPARWEKRREPKPERRRREPSRTHQSPRRSCSRSRDKPLRGYINTISGGFAGGGSSSTAWKRHVRALKSVHLVEKKVRSMPPITFTDEDFKAPDPDDPMVVSIEVAEYGIKKVLVDQGSSVNILYWKTFRKMNLSEDLIVPYNEQIVGFSGERVDTRGYLDLRTRIGSRRDGREVRVRFLFVEANTTYNVLLGRPCLNAFGVIVSTLHLAMKFPSDKGTICTVHADQYIARQCYVAGLKIAPYSRPKKQHRSEVAMTDLDPRTNTEDRIQPGGDTKEIAIGTRPDQITKIGGALRPDEEELLGAVILENKDLFAWLTTDMSGIHPGVMSHKLAIYREARPVAQKKRKMGEEWRKAIEEEVKKLEGAGFIREIKYTTWLANVVMVKKASGKWRMCTDFTDLNKACPKDAYPLPQHRSAGRWSFGTQFPELPGRILKVQSNPYVWSKQIQNGVHH